MTGSLDATVASPTSLHEGAHDFRRPRARLFGMAEVHADTGTDDPHQWLEEVTGIDALSWVRARNAETIRTLTTGGGFAGSRDEIRAVLDADDRIPYVTRHGEHLYNLGRNESHPRGLWRRTTLAEYRRTESTWEVLLDVDALAESAGENWVFRAVIVLRPDHHRALVALSRGGADAAVVREFDITAGQFIVDGFALPEAETNVSWIDEDRIYVATDFGDGSVPSSARPRFSTWRDTTSFRRALRGWPSTATLIFPTNGALSANTRHITMFVTTWTTRRRYS